MIRAIILALAGLLALGGCDVDRGDEVRVETSPGVAPLIYEVADSRGEVRGWLLGTIHALPDGTRWRTRPIAQAIATADHLLVEIADIDRPESIAVTFGELATTPGMGPLAARIDPSLRPALAEMIARSGIDPARFDSTETWAAALMLARVDASGDPANGVDRALVEEFGPQHVAGFEVSPIQLGIFDRLAERDQRDLLELTIAQWLAGRGKPDRLQQAWLAGDEAALSAAMDEGILSDPQLRAALLVDRNAGWMPTLLAALESPRRPLVAVGTAHLLGPDGLVALLEQRGYTVRRL